MTYNDLNHFRKSLKLDNIWFSKSYSYTSLNYIPRQSFVVLTNFSVLLKLHSLTERIFILNFYCHRSSELFPSLLTLFNFVEELKS